jgi:hypothetical protein
MRSTQRVKVTSKRCLSDYLNQQRNFINKAQTECTGVTHPRIEELVSERRREKKNFHKISLLLGKTLEESFFLRPLL